MSTSNFKFQVIYKVNIQVIVFTVVAFSQRILKLGLKMRSLSKSAFPGLLKNALTFNPRWLEGLVMVARTFLIFFSTFKSELIMRRIDLP